MKKDMGNFIKTMNVRRSGNGRIAHLEKELRDEICRMIWDGKSYPKIVAAMGEKGLKLFKQNLVTWRRGGYQDWLSDQEHVLNLERIREYALRIVKEHQGTAIQEAGIQVAAAQVYELLVNFDASVLRKKFKGDTAGYTKLVNVMARLGDGALRYERYRAEVAERKAKIQAQIEEVQRGGLTKERLANIEKELNLL